MSIEGGTTRRHVIRSAASMFVKQGFERANVEHLETPVLATKQQLFLAVTGIIAEQQREAARVALLQQGSLTEMVRRLFYALVELAESERDCLTVYLQSRALFPEQIALQNRPYVQLITEMVQVGVVHGEISCNNMETAALLLISLLEAFLLSALSADQSADELVQQAETVTRQLLKALYRYGTL